MGLVARTARTLALRGGLLISSNVALWVLGKPASEGVAVKRASSRVRPHAKRLPVFKGAAGVNFDDFLAGTKMERSGRLKEW